MSHDGGLEEAINFSYLSNCYSLQQRQQFLLLSKGFAANPKRAPQSSSPTVEKAVPRRRLAARIGPIYGREMMQSFNLVAAVFALAALVATAAASNPFEGLSCEAASNKYFAIVTGQLGEQTEGYAAQLG